ncbi:MAG: hypothetical protein ABR505_05570 [Actinomycetota bacterium]
MTERRRVPERDELERALRRLAREVEFPETPDVARAVTARLEKGPLAPPARLPRAGWRTRPALVFAAAGLALVAVTASLIAFPAARRAVADWLGVSGIRIETETKAPSPAEGRLDLGIPTSLTQVAGEVDFEVLVPAALGPPDEVFLREPPEGGMVTLVYRSRPGLRSRVPGVGLILSQFEGHLRPDLIKKITAGGTRVRGAEVSGLPAYWLSGAPHSFLYLDESGRIAEDTVRLAGNVLLWERGVTYRLESELSLDAAIAIAESLR